MSEAGWVITNGITLCDEETRSRLAWQLQQDLTDALSNLLERLNEYGMNQ